MRQFLIMRHAKSSWDAALASDHDRPLNGRGRLAAEAMGGWLAAEGLVPDAVLLSSAARTVETWARVSAAFSDPPLALGDRELYLAWPEKVIDMLQAVDPRAQRVLLLNHEPTVSALAELLSRPPVEAACARALGHFPTGAVAVLEFDGNWVDVAARSMRFARFQAPREL